MLHEEVAVQVLDLVAEGPGGETLGLRLKPVAVPVLSPDPDDVGPLHHGELPRHAEAALETALLALGLDDLGVDELQIALIGLVQHQADPAQDAHLWRGQACAVGVRQGLRHVVQQLMQAAVEGRHRAADLGEAAVPF